MRGLRRAMPHGDVTLGQLARAAGLQEVLHVFFHQIRMALQHHRRGAALGREELELRAIDSQVALRAAELDALAGGPFTAAGSSPALTKADQSARGGAG